MPAFGYTLSSEEHPPDTLVHFARRAEGAGFEFASISDHYYPSGPPMIQWPPTSPGN